MSSFAVYNPSEKIQTAVQNLDVGKKTTYVGDNGFEVQSAMDAGLFSLVIPSGITVVVGQDLILESGNYLRIEVQRGGTLVFQDAGVLGAGAILDIRGAPGSGERWQPSEATEAETSVRIIHTGAVATPSEFILEMMMFTDIKVEIDSGPNESVVFGQAAKFTRCYMRNTECIITSVNTINPAVSFSGLSYIEFCTIDCVGSSTTKVLELNGVSVRSSQIGYGDTIFRIVGCTFLATDINGSNSGDAAVEQLGSITYIGGSFRITGAFIDTGAIGNKYDNCLVIFTGTSTAPEIGAHRSTYTGCNVLCLSADGLVVSGDYVGFTGCALDVRGTGLRVTGDRCGVSGGYPIGGISTYQLTVEASAANTKVIGNAFTGALVDNGTGTQDIGNTL